MTIEMQNTGDSRARREILAGVEHVLVIWRRVAAVNYRISCE